NPIAATRAPSGSIPQGCATKCGECPREPEIPVAVLNDNAIDLQSAQLGECPIFLGREMGEGGTASLEETRPACVSSNPRKYIRWPSPLRAAQIAARPCPPVSTQPGLSPAPPVALAPSGAR